MYMTDALHSQVFTPHTIPYHIPSSRSERARQGGLLLPKHCDSRPPSQLIIRFA